MSSHRASISPHWDIDIVSKPSAQRYVPPSPEFRDTFRNVGVIEVLRQFKPQQLSNSNRHIRIAREIIIELQ